MSKPNLTLALLIGFSFSALAYASTPVSESFEATADGRVEISNIAGSIEVVGWDRAEIEITGTLQEGAELDIDRSRGRVSIEVDIEDGHKGRWGGDWGGAELTLHIPDGSRLAIETVSADQNVENLNGELELESVSGVITVADSSPERLEIGTVSGDIRIDAQCADSEIGTVSGTATLRGLSGRLDASTVSGEIKAIGDTFLRVELETVSGEVLFDGDLSAGSRASASTMSGTVTLRLPASIGADVETETFSGKVINRFSSAVERSDSDGERSFRLGSGGARIEIASFSGTVIIEPR